MGIIQKEVLCCKSWDFNGTLNSHQCPYPFVLFIDLKIGKTVNSILIYTETCHNLISKDPHWCNQCSQGINISNHMVIHVNAHDLLDLEFIYIFIYSIFTGINLIHSFSILVQYVH